MMHRPLIRAALMLEVLLLGPQAFAQKPIIEWALYRRSGESILASTAETEGGPTGLLASYSCRSGSPGLFEKRYFSDRAGTDSALAQIARDKPGKLGRCDADCLWLHKRANRDSFKAGDRVQAPRAVRTWLTAEPTSEGLRRALESQFEGRHPAIQQGAVARFMMACRTGGKR